MHSDFISKMKGAMNNMRDTKSPKLITDLNLYQAAVKKLSINQDDTKNIKFVKELKDGNISKIKKSTVFPDSWSEKEIVNAINQAGDSTIIATRARDGVSFHRQIINGVEIDLIKV